MPATPTPEVSVILPTLALRERTALLWRAIDSIVTQHGVRAHPLVVVNGDRADAALLRQLELRPDLRLLRLAEAGLPGALCAGCRAVATPWLAELDDDDELHPQALATRIEALRCNPAAIAAISNGHLRIDGRLTLLREDFRAARADPLMALCRANWLSPGALTMRTEAATPQLFAGMPRCLEWTFLAIRLAQHGPLLFLDEPGFIYSGDTPYALSRSRDYLFGLPEALNCILAQPLPEAVRRRFEERLAAACNGAMLAELAAGRRAAAWRWHLHTLRQRRGWRYLPATRRLLLPSLAAPSA